MKKILFTFSLALAFLSLPFLAKAAVCEEDTIVNFVARDPEGAYISGASVEIYKQATDANGQPKPGSRVDYGTTNATLGWTELRFRNADALSANYAIRVQTVNKEAARFYFYNLELACGQTLDLEKTLSGILVNLYDSDGSRLKDTSFSLYSQLYSGTTPLNEKKELIAALNSGSSGSAKIYLPQGSLRSLSGAISDDYALELTRSGVKFVFYGIHVSDGQLTTLNYYLSALRVKLQDSSGAVYPANTLVEVYRQEISSNNERQKGDKMGSFKIGSDGYGTFEVPAGVYVLAVKGSNNAYQYFWDVEVQDGQTSEHTITADQSGTSIGGTCPDSSQLTLSLRSYSGVLAAGLKFEVYEQSSDANGLPIAGKKVASGTIGSSGQATVTFKPDPRLNYAIKVWDKRADRGEYWLFNAVRFVCGYNRNFSRSLPALRIILRDGQGELKRNYSFALYAQNYDADGEPVKADNGLIANLKTDSGGQAIVFVSPYNPYRSGQTGVYAIQAKDGSNNSAMIYDIRIPEDGDYTLNYSFSGFQGRLRTAQGQALGNRDVFLYEQAEAGVSLGKELAKVRTDSGGNFGFEYPAGTYAIVIKDDYGRPNAFWQVPVKAGNSGRYQLSANVTNLSLSDTVGSNALKDASLKLYSLSRSSGNSFYRDRELATLKLSGGRVSGLNLASGAYLAVYVGASGQEYGQAFYAQNGRVENIKVTVSAKNLVSGQNSFTLSIPNLSAGLIGPASNNSGSANSSASPSGPIASRLKGRILLQVQDKGQAWYVNPTDGRRYYLGRPADAFALMRRFGLGISNSDFASLASNPSAWKRLAGRILLKVEDSGKAYYFDPLTLELHYLGRPDDAFNVMRTRGLGITNSDLGQINSGE